MQCTLLHQRQLARWRKVNRAYHRLQLLNSMRITGAAGRVALRYLETCIGGLVLAELKHVVHMNRLRYIHSRQSIVINQQDRQSLHCPPWGMQWELSAAGWPFIECHCTWLLSTGECCCSPFAGGCICSLACWCSCGCSNCCRCWWWWWWCSCWEAPSARSKTKGAYTEPSHHDSLLFILECTETDTMEILET